VIATPQGCDRGETEDEQSGRDQRARGTPYAAG
jgi:hypothetical protein